MSVEKNEYDVINRTDDCRNLFRLNVETTDMKCGLIDGIPIYCSDKLEPYCDINAQKCVNVKPTHTADSSGEKAETYDYSDVIDRCKIPDGKKAKIAKDHNDQSPVELFEKYDESDFKKYAFNVGMSQYCKYDPSDLKFLSKWQSINSSYTQDTFENPNF